ncbi:Mss4-like protein [Cercophora samala]|uniref:Mss4-like protein n=1 Tax=Cercophora samala TaxID=330535 RepID=A0AA40DI66_9PEZI|nr:Mss4-like protein [Cercophora samala]
MTTQTSSSEPPTTSETPDKNEQTYACSCHCGSVTFDVTLSPPLAEQTVMECNCSICRRAGYLLVFPPKKAVVFSPDSLPRLSRYQFNTKQIDHLFCGHCGSSLGIDFREFRSRGYGISVRAFNNVDLETLQYQKGDGKAKIPPYTDLSGVQWALDHSQSTKQAEEAV